MAWRCHKLRTWFGQPAQAAAFPAASEAVPGQFSGTGAGSGAFASIVHAGEVVARCKCVFRQRSACPAREAQQIRRFLLSGAGSGQSDKGCVRRAEGSANCWGPLLPPPRCCPDARGRTDPSRAQSPARLPALWRFASVARRCSVRLGAEVTRMESDSDDVPLAQRVPKAAPKAAPAAAQGAVKRKATSPSADARPKKPKPAAPSKPRAESGAARAKKQAVSADESSSGEDDDDADEAKAGRSASRAAKKLEKDRKAVDEMSRIKKGVRLHCWIGPQTVACVACVTVRSCASLFKG